jgi:diguanylate cyclase (GGDEF)-like protein/PAS domain S-box-containing protein
MRAGKVYVASRRAVTWRRHDDEAAGSVMGRRCYAFVASGVALATLYYLLPAKPADLVVWPIIGWASVVAVVVGVRVNRAELRLAWYLLAAGLAMQVTGDSIYSIQNHLGSGTVPFPSYIDFFYLAMYPLLIGGVTLLVRHQTSGRDRSSLIDVGIITVSLGLLSWVLLIAPYIHDTGLGTLERLISIAYPIGDVALLATAARLAVGGGRRTISFWLLTTSIVPMVGADALYGYLSLAGVYPEHSFIEAGWMAFYIGWGAAALHPSMGELSAANPSTALISRARLVVIGSAILVSPAVLFIQDEMAGDRDHVAATLTGAVLLMLVLIRVARSVRDSTEARSDARFRVLVDKTSDAILVVDGKGRIRDHTPSTERMLGRAAAELEGTRLSELLTQADGMRLLAMLSSEVSSATIEWRVQRPDREWRDLEVIADDLRGVPDLDGIVFTMRDITDRKLLDLELRRQTLTDSLTGLANRTQFIVRVDQALQGAKRSDASVVVLFVNLDDFKMVSDSLGPAAGDALLVAVAARLTTAASATDSTVARLGGDEFGFMLEHSGTRKGPELVALQIQAALHAPFVVMGKEVRVHASIGIAVGSASTHTPDDVLRDADLAMSFAKKKGKDRFELFLPEMHQDATRRLEVAAELLGGIERGEFLLYYQPIVDVRNGHVLGVEALVRWQHPRRGLLSPGEFIRVAEMTGLIIPLDCWILNEACRQAKVWKVAGVADDSFYVSANLSPQHLQDASVVQSVSMALEASGLAARALVLEVTESALIDDLDSAGASLGSLKQLGVRVAADDFGTGYSSLAHLIKFPIDLIKIDKTFIDLVNSADGEMMVRAVVDLAHTLGLKAIAEGVERPEQALALELLGCYLAQGYLFSKPLAPDDLAALLASQFAGAVAATAS